MRFARRGLQPAHVKFAQYLRDDAAFARLRGDLAGAERKQREAVEKLRTVGNPFDVAAARGNWRKSVPNAATRPRRASCSCWRCR